MSARALVERVVERHRTLRRVRTAAGPPVHDDLEKGNSSRRPSHDSRRSGRESAKEEWRAFAVVAAVSAMCVLYNIVTAFMPKPVGLVKTSGRHAGAVGCGIRATICAVDALQMSCLALSRISAYAMYPSLVLLFVTKAHGLRTFLGRSCLAVWVPFHDLHALHAACGRAVGVCSLIHGVGHVARWAIRGDSRFLYAHVTGRTGVLALLAAPVVVLPMAWGRLRKKVRYEVRKGLHTAGALVMGIAVALHAPKSVVAYVVGPALAVYAADVLYQVFALTFHIETTVFHRLEHGVQLSFENPPGFRTDAIGYVYVMIPWIAKDQWHAFSLYQSPEHPGYSSVCVSAVGDWTRKLHAEVTFDTVRPCYVCGPFTSPYATASNFDNLVLVASGIGITPAINILAAAKETRRCNLLWMCRDASLVEFYLSAVEFDDDGYTVVYYTGKRELCVDTSRLPARVLVFAKRPNLPRAILGLIHAIETGTGLPEDAVRASEEAKARASDAHRRQSEPGDAPMDRFAAAVRAALRANGRDDVVDRFVLAGGAEGVGPDALAAVAARHGADLSEADAAQVAAELPSREALGAFIHAHANAMGQAPSLAKLDVHRDSLREEFSQSHESSRNSVSAADIFGEAGVDVDREAFFDACGARLSRWEILYCGGAQPVVDALTKFSREFFISFRKEKFDW